MKIMKPETFEKLRVFVSVDDDGNEALLGGTTADGDEVPLIACDEDRYRSCVIMARRIANVMGRPVHVLEFSGRVQVAVIQP